MSRPFALLLRSRNVDKTPCAVSFMIRWNTISVKYTLPSRSTAGPSVKATVVAISGCCAVASPGTTTQMRAKAPARPSRRRCVTATSIRPDTQLPAVRESRPHAEADEAGRRQQPKASGDGFASAQPLARTAGIITDQPIDDEREQHINRPEQEHLASRVPGRRIHELRQETQKKQNGFRIGHAGGDALPEHAMVLLRDLAHRGEHMRAIAKRSDAEVCEIQAAAVLDDSKRKVRRADQGGDAE